MAGYTRTPRTRGLISGLFLFLLGAWGGLGPFVAPYFRYGFKPDQAWAYSSGRFFLSALPGAVTLLAGLTIMVTRGRVIGGSGAVIAALAGAWFIAGASLLSLLPAQDRVTAGQPIQAGSAAATLAQLGLFTGVGMLVLCFAGLALGRFSLAAVRDLTIADEDYEYDYEGTDYQPGPPPLELPAAGGPFATTERIAGAEHSG